MKWEKIVMITVALLILMVGFSIRINDFHYEFKGLLAIIFKMIYGQEL